MVSHPFRKLPEEKQEITPALEDEFQNDDWGQTEIFRAAIS